MASSQDYLQKAAQVILQAKNDVNDLLSDPVHGMVIIGVNSTLDQIINRLNFLGGSQVQTIAKQEFPPVTEFMGEELTLPKQITKEDLSPAEYEKQLFVDKVDRLYNEFSSIEPEGILNSYTIPEDVLVVRGVAKRAGVEDFDTREMNVPFMEAIAKGIKAKAEREAEQKRIDDELKKQQGSGTSVEDGEPSEIVNLTTALMSLKAEADQFSIDRNELVAKEVEAEGSWKTRYQKQIADLDVRLKENETKQTELNDKLKALTA